jgi:hypothetical protein
MTQSIWVDRAVKVSKAIEVEAAKNNDKKQQKEGATKPAQP